MTREPKRIERLNDGPPQDATAVLKAVDQLRQLEEADKEAAFHDLVKRLHGGTGPDAGGLADVLQALNKSTQDVENAIGVYRQRLAWKATFDRANEVTAALREAQHKEAVAEQAYNNLIRDETAKHLRNREVLQWDVSRAEQNLSDVKRAEHSLLKTAPESLLRHVNSLQRRRAELQSALDAANKIAGTARGHIAYWTQSDRREKEQREHPASPTTLVDEQTCRWRRPEMSSDIAKNTVERLKQYEDKIKTIRGELNSVASQEAEVRARFVLVD